MKEDKNIPQKTAESDFNHQEPSKEANGAAFTSVNLAPRGDGQAPEAEGETSFDPQIPDSETTMESANDAGQNIQEQKTAFDLSSTDAAKGGLEETGETQPDERIVDNDPDEDDSSKSQSEKAPSYNKEEPESLSESETSHNSHSVQIDQEAQTGEGGEDKGAETESMPASEEESESDHISSTGQEALTELEGGANEAVPNLTVSQTAEVDEVVAAEATGNETEDKPLQESEEDASENKPDQQSSLEGNANEAVPNLTVSQTDEVVAAEATGNETEDTPLEESEGDTSENKPDQQSSLEGSANETASNLVVSQTGVDEVVAAEATGNETEDKPLQESEEDTSEKKPDQQPLDPLAKWELEDYQNYSKEELLKVVDQILKGNNVLLADRVLNRIKPYYDHHRKAAKDRALEQFIADGNDTKDFDYKYDQFDHRFDANFRLIKDRKREYYKNLEKEKDQNLIIKNGLLEELRELVHGEETKISMDALKSLQSRWKAVGQVPRAQVRTLWANYNALLDLFYDQRSIYFELKELDRRKNLEAKEELCEKAEQLVEEKNLKEAINQLNELHHEYKHLGPVPKTVQEALWQRFKAASDKIYMRRKEFVKHIKEEQKGNLELKQGLVAEVKTLASFDSDRITDWNKQTNELLAVQKRWEAVGGIPKEYAKTINKEFWSLFKQFFHHKNQFFKKLEKQRDENLIKKQALVEKAKVLKDSTDWEKTAQELKDIQQEWRNIGPVPEKQKKAIYSEFKSACDAFFEHRRGRQKVLDVEYVENLKQKEAICERLEQMAKENSDDLETFKQLQAEFDQIGYVPSNTIRKIRKKYQTAVAHFLKEAEGIDEHEKQQLKFSQEFNRIKSGPNANRKLGQKEQAIRREIGKVENDISLWKNNLEFFASSKTADKLREEFNEKIEKASDHLYDLKSQLRMLRSI